MPTISPQQILNDLNNRLRILESKESLLNERLLVTSKNVIEEYKKVSKEIKAVDEELKEVKKDLENIKNIMRHMSEEMGSFAKREKVDVLEKYINLWNPMKFVTEAEVRNIIREMLREKGGA